MSRAVVSSLIVAFLTPTHQAHADPIHAIAGGAFWHHDSGWVFPEAIAEFTRVGIPQDVAGSNDAVAYYARFVDGSRIVASVDVYPADSAAAESLEEGAGELEGESALAPDTGTSLPVTRRIFHADGAKSPLTVLYFVSAGEWRVRIRIADAHETFLPLLDLFARQQQWTSLSAVPTPR